jgi:hypothetical protein
LLDIPRDACASNILATSLKKILLSITSEQIATATAATVAAQTNEHAEVALPPVEAKAPGGGDRDVVGRAQWLVRTAEQRCRFPCACAALSRAKPWNTPAPKRSM